MRRCLRSTVVSLVLLVSLAALPYAAVAAPAQPARSAAPAMPAPATETVNIYLVALEDGGRSGIPVGCGDSLIPVQVEIPAAPTTEGKIAGALSRLFAIRDQFYGQSGLYNSLYQSNLAVDSVTIDHGTATVRLTGSMALGGVCDDPRAEGQIRQTAMQFPGINDVMILLNGDLLFQRMNTRFFPETGQLVGGGFLAFWEQFGGLPVFGYPLTNEFKENGLTVQYFERARFEWHPGAWPSHYDVLLGRLGAERTANRGLEDPFKPQSRSTKPDCVFFQGPNHNLCAGFLAYWQRFGGLAIYGYPISEEFVENGMTVQYFERARFEWHPGAAPARYDVLLGRVGAEVLASRPQ